MYNIYIYTVNQQKYNSSDSAQPSTALRPLRSQCGHSISHVFHIEVEGSERSWISLKS